jgi:hypothetical protein
MGKRVNRRWREDFVAILAGGIVAGTIDIGAACLITGRDLPFILHVIAGGILGRASFDGAVPTAILGAILQEAMGVLIAAIYVIASRFALPLAHRWVAAGLGYGVVVFFVMNYVVVPLSAWKRVPHFSLWSFTSNMIAMLLFGLIVAFFARRPPGGPLKEALRPG